MSFGTLIFTLRKCAYSIALLALSAGVSHAATISYNFSYGPEGIPQSSHIVGNLPLFDSSLGTLTQVSLNLNATTDSGSITFDNESGVPSTVNTLGIGATVTVAGQYGGLAVAAVPTQIGSGTVTADEASDGTGDFAGPDSFTVVGNSGTDSNTFSTSSPGVLAAYTGVGTFSVSGDSVLYTVQSITGGFGPTQTANGQTSGTVTVTYTYTPAPEPSTLVLGGLGLVGLLVVGAKRRAIAK